MKKSLRLLLVFLSLAFLILPSRTAHTQSASSSVEYQSYLAHIAAASTSSRLHDTAAAKRWLANAPHKHRDWEWHGVAEQSTLTFTTDAPVNSLAISPDGKMLAITSDKACQNLERRQRDRTLQKVRSKPDATVGGFQS